MEESTRYQAIREAFSYEAINKRLEGITEDDFRYSTSSSASDPFITFKSFDRGTKNPYGWKAHISLLEDDENIGKVWDWLVDVLVRYGVNQAKVLKKGTQLPEFQQGKEITIYFQEGDIKWAEMFQEIENFMSENNVGSSYKPLGDMPFSGSQFLSCRCDLDNFGKYLSSLQVETHNPSGRPHVFESVKIIRASQIVKPFRKNESRVKSFYANLEEKRQELLNDFRNKIVRFERVAGFHKIDDSDIDIVYGKFIKDIPSGLKNIVFLGQEWELMLKRAGDVIESMEEKDYFLFSEALSEKFKKTKALIGFVYELINDNPESAPHSSEGSVVRRDSEGKVKNSSSDDRGSAVDEAKRSHSEESHGDAVESSASSDEDDALQEDFTHRMPISPRVRK